MSECFTEGEKKKKEKAKVNRDVTLVLLASSAEDDNDNDAVYTNYTVRASRASEEFERSLSLHKF